MRFFFAAFLLCTLPCNFAGAAAPAESSAREAPPKPPKSDGFVFSLLPKSFQKNPRLSFNIFTEMTDEGRKLVLPTSQQPAYFIAQSAGVHATGLGAEQGLTSPPPQKLEQLMLKSLAEGNYLPSDNPAHPPTLMIVYFWGSHSFHPEEDDAVPVPELTRRKALIERAMLLGGVKFATEVGRAMEQVDQLASMQQSFVAAPGSDFGGSVAALVRDPFEELSSRSVEMARMVDELFSSSFFVVASAYDYAAMTKGQRRLLWRTKLTVNSLGVNMVEAVPPLISSAGPYFGRETDTPVVIDKRVSREGRVEIGTPVAVPEQNAPGK